MCVPNYSTDRPMNAKVAQPQKWPFALILRLNLKIITLDNKGDLAGHVSTNKCAGIVGCSFYSFELNRSSNPKWQLLGYATIAFSEQYIPKNL
jgi:hypothetical protein